jgi:two-component system NarL family sensor kinase
MHPDASTLQRRNHELAILNQIAEALNREVNLSQALHTALGLVAELCNLRTGWIWLLNEQTGVPYLAAAQHLPPALTSTPQTMEGTCYCLDLYRAGEMNNPANVNVITCSRLKNFIDGTAGLRYHASIPLNAHQRQLGVLNLASSDWRELAPDDLRMLATIGDLLGMAIERARLFANSVQLGALEERNRLARDIHDTLAQGLTAIALKLETVDALLETNADHNHTRTVVQQALTLAQHNLEEVRRSVLDLRAAPLEGRTLAETLADLCETIKQRGTDVEVTFTVLGADHPLPLRVAVGLYRIAQEATNNVIHHAAAHKLHVTLRIEPSQAQLTVNDDGCGFVLNKVPQGRYGLVGMHERIRLLNGMLDIQSNVGQGTQLRATVPLEQHP